MTAAQLQHPSSDYIGGRFVPIAGDDLRSWNPADPAETIWQGTPIPAHVDEAVAAARSVAGAWGSVPFEQRAELLRRWQEVTAAHADRIAGLICREMGKPMAECRFEAKALGGKVDVTLGEVSRERVVEYQVDVSPTRSGRCRYKPHGVMAVVGPFNFPAHLPNGQFIPALLMGNTVVFKPSEKTAAVGQLLAELMEEAGAPPGVFNVIQGGGDIAAALVDHEGIDGVLFTGSWPVGRRILEANLDRPGRLIALEMGGNNPTVVCADAHRRQAVIECGRAAFATTGQRCTCTRRVIVERAVAQAFISELCEVAANLRFGPGDSAEPVFMGPLITDDAVQAVLTYQDRLGKGGATVHQPCRAMEASGSARPRDSAPGHFCTAGVVEVDRFDLDNDCEVFGPLVQVSVVDDLDEAIAQANATRFGLAAAIFTTSQQNYQRFFDQVNAGCINHNTGTAGASSQLPFGGLGQSGNHRPAAAFAIDFCGYPVANMLETSDDASVPPGMEVGPEPHGIA